MYEYVVIIVIFSFVFDHISSFARRLSKNKSFKERVFLFCLEHSPTAQTTDRKQQQQYI